MFHCKKVNSKINHIHQRALCIVYKINVLSFEELLQLVKLFKIHHKNVQSLASLAIDRRGQISFYASDVFGRIILLAYPIRHAKYGWSKPKCTCD